MDNYTIKATKLDFKKTNTIAYDKNLREKINKIHKLLSVEITDITGEPMLLNIDNFIEIEKIRKDISSILANVNLHLLKKNEEILTNIPNEKILINKLKILITVISKDIVSSSYNMACDINDWLKKAEIQRKELSSLTSDLTLTLMSAKNDKKGLTYDEKKNYKEIEDLTKELGNFLYRYTRLVNNIESQEKRINKIIKLCNPLMDKITVFIQCFNLKKNNDQNLKNLVTFLGNLNFNINKTLILIQEYKKESQKTNKQSFELTKGIMELQSKFRIVRANINDLSFISKDPEIAYKFNNSPDF